MTFTDAAVAVLWPWLFRGSSAPTLASTWQIALYSDNGASTEIAVGAYARQTLTRNSTDWLYSSLVVSNGVLVAFPTATAGYTVRSYAIVNTTTGAQWFTRQLATPKVVAINDAVRFPVGRITLTFSSQITSYASGVLAGYLFQGDAAPTLPTDWDATFYSDGTCSTEITTGGFTRQALTIGTTDWGALSARQIKNALQEQQGSPTADNTVRGLALLDGSSNQWWKVALAGDVAVTNGGTALEIPANGLVMAA